MVYQLLNSQNQKYPNRLIKLSPANFVKIEFGSEYHSADNGMDPQTGS